MTYRPFLICLLTAGSLSFASDNNSAIELSSLTHLIASSPDSLSYLPHPYPTTQDYIPSPSSLLISELEQKEAEKYLANLPLSKKDKSDFPIGIKKHLSYINIGSPLAQDEADAAMILQRFCPDFFEDETDYDKLSCTEFTSMIIQIYKDALAIYIASLDKEVATKPNIYGSFPESLQRNITSAIGSYVATITFAAPPPAGNPPKQKLTIEAKAS